MHLNIFGRKETIEEDVVAAEAQKNKNLLNKKHLRQSGRKICIDPNPKAHSVR